MASSTRSFFGHEDWLVILIGFIVLGGCCWMAATQSRSTEQAKPQVVNALKGKIAKLEPWTSNPLDSVALRSPSENAPANLKNIYSLVFTWSVLGILLLPIAIWKQMRPAEYWTGFAVLAALGTLAFVLASQKVIKYYNFEYVLWALMLGLLISNTVGVPRLIRPMMIGDTIIKIGFFWVLRFYLANWSPLGHPVF
jgi:hypothetical protein